MSILVLFHAGVIFLLLLSVNSDSIESEENELTKDEMFKRGMLKLLRCLQMSSVNIFL